MKKTYKLSIKYGALVGLVSSSLIVMIYMVDLSLFLDSSMNIFTTLLMFLLTMSFGILAILGLRKFLNGYISFIKAFLVFFNCAVFSLIISGFVSYMLFNFIDKDAGVVLNEQIIEVKATEVEELLFNRKVPRHIIRQEINKIETTNFLGITEIIKLNIVYMILSAFLGGLVALILKKKDPSEVF